MSKNYTVLHYLRKQVNDFNGDERLYKILSRCFNLIYEHQERDGCLSNSVALYVCLKHIGYHPQLCYGLIEIIGGAQFYHVWLELDNKIIDLAIYGNVNFSPIFSSSIKLDLPIALEFNVSSKIQYHKFVFDGDWERAQISRAENWTIYQYIINSPMRGMYKLIAKILDEPFKDKVENIVVQYKNIRIVDFKNNYLTQKQLK